MAGLPDISIGLIPFVLRKVRGLLGLLAILKKAVRMPAFWSLMAMLAMQIVGFTIIMYLTN